jgi:hypothetical protein
MRNGAPPVRHGNESRLTGWEVNNGFEAWVLARYLGQVQPDADFIPAASRALYTATTDVQRRRDVGHRASGFEEFRSLISFEPR